MSAQNGTDANVSSITLIAGTGSAPSFAVDVAALGGICRQMLIGMNLSIG